MWRLWAVEGATGTGALLAQQLVAVGETIVDVPPKLSARVRVLDSGHSDKNDRHDARSAAVVALRHHDLRVVEREDHLAVLRLLAKRHHDLTAARTRAVCRLHTTLCYLAEGHFPKRMSAGQAAAILARIRPVDAVGVERKAMARCVAGNALTGGVCRWPLWLPDRSDECRVTSEVRARVARGPSCPARQRFRGPQAIVEPTGRVGLPGRGIGRTSIACGP
jgi:hypothetical protein